MILSLSIVISLAFNRLLNIMVLIIRRIKIILNQCDNYINRVIIYCTYQIIYAVTEY